VTESYSEPTGVDDGAEALVVAPSYVQLTQQRVRLRRAAEVFATPDDAGRYPIVVLVKQGGRFQTELLVVAAVIAAAVVLAPLPPLLTIAGLVLTVVFVLAGSARAVFMPVPEGTQAVLAERGRFLRVAGPGVQRVPPTVVVTHLVTTREIPFGTLVRAAPTADDVRIDVEILFTFRIDDPGKFVFNTTAPDFDAVCLGAAQAIVRETARTVLSEQALDLAGQESKPLREALTTALERYGVTVSRVLVVRVDPPGEFLATRESRRLAVLRTTEQEEQAGFGRRVQADRDALARQEAEARFERARAQAELAAAVRRREVELDAEIEAVRMAKLEERLAAYPDAMRWDWAGQRLKVARKLAGNSRALIQLGGSGDIADALVARTAMEAAGDEAAGDETAGSVALAAAAGAAVPADD
jgi:regulator of protease activity HflC (stomatin/prohibitin superfamily)